MTDTPKTAADAIVTAPPGGPETPPKTPTESPPVVGDPEVVANPIVSEQKSVVAPTPLKI